jgi:hypothetical protein
MIRPEMGTELARLRVADILRHTQRRRTSPTTRRPLPRRGD